MRTLALILCAVAFACKARDPSSGGLLSPETATTAAALTSNPLYSIRCAPSEEGAPAVVYQFEVQSRDEGDADGAETEDGEPTLTLSLFKTSHDTSTKGSLALDVVGTGSVSPQGAVLVSFADGVLSADWSPQSTAHLGLLTLQNDAEADGLQVRCDVSIDGTANASTAAKDPQE